jgi:hypothetical protein
MMAGTSPAPGALGATTTRAGIADAVSAAVACFLPKGDDSPKVTIVPLTSGFTWWLALSRVLAVSEAEAWSARRAGDGEGAFAGRVRADAHLDAASAAFRRTVDAMKERNRWRSSTSSVV